MYTQRYIFLYVDGMNSKYENMHRKINDLLRIHTHILIKCNAKFLQNASRKCNQIRVYMNMFANTYVHVVKKGIYTNVCVFI